MKLVYNIENSDLYNNFITDNYKSISISENFVYKGLKTYINRNIIMEKIKEQNYDKKYDISKKELVYKIIEKFLKEKISYRGISSINNETHITLITKDEKTLNITSPLIKEELIEQIKNINIIDDTYYKMIDKDKIKKIKIIAIKNNDIIKSVMYKENSKELKIIISINDNLLEIKKLIDYYKKNQKLEEIEIINIENYKKSKIYANDNNEINIIGKEIIEYLEGNDKNDNNGKISKHM